jgi:hypothetical protein
MAKINKQNERLKKTKAKPRIIKEDNKRAFLVALRTNAGNISESCKAAQISRGSYYKWLNIDPDFAQACQDIKESMIDLAESKLYQEIENSNLTAIIFYLKCQAKHRGYSEHHSAPDAEERKILTEYAAGTIDAIQAGTRYAMIGRPLPDVLRMQLAKMEPPETDAGDEGVYTDEELDADFQAMAAKVDEEKDRWLPNRREQVAEMKRDLEGNQRAGGDTDGGGDGKGDDDDDAFGSEED